MFGVGAGKRRSKIGRSGPKEEHNYVALEQGVFSVETPIIDQSPMIQEGVCGTPIIYVGKKIQEEKENLAKGIVGGFMCYTDNFIGTSPKSSNALLRLPDYRGIFRCRMEFMQKDLHCVFGFRVGAYQVSKFIISFFAIFSSLWVRRCMFRRLSVHL